MDIREEMVDRCRELVVQVKVVNPITDLLATHAARLDILPQTVHAINHSVVVADLVVADVVEEVVVEDMHSVWWLCMSTRHLMKRVPKLDLRTLIPNRKTEYAPGCLLYAGACSVERKSEYSLTKRTSRSFEE